MDSLRALAARAGRPSPLAAVLAAGAVLVLVSVLGGVGGVGPLGGVFSGPAVQDVNDPGPHGASVRKARGRPARRHPRGPSRRGRALIRSEPSTADGGAAAVRRPAGGGPAPLREGDPPAAGPGAPPASVGPAAPSAPSRPPAGPGGGGTGGARGAPPPSGPVDTVGDTVNGVGNSLPDPVREPAQNVVDGLLRPQ